MISGITGISHKSPIQSITTFNIAAVRSLGKKIGVTAVIFPRNLPLHPIPFDLKWDHLSNVQLADRTFGQPGRIDILLGVNVFVNVLFHGRRFRLHGSPVAFENRIWLGPHR